MARQIQIRRGSAAAHANFTGAVGEITMDTTNKTLRVHDGITPGGVELARADKVSNVVQLPDNYDFVIDCGTSDNGWWRKYKSGWCEQGGTINNSNIKFPINFTDTNYTVIAIADMLNDGVGNISICYTGKRTNGVNIQVRWNGGAHDSAPRMWTAWGF